MKSSGRTSLFLLSALVTLSNEVYPILALPHREVDSPMLQMLNTMNEMMTGDPQFNPAYYDELRTCWETFDSRLVMSQDASWQGMIDYWTQNGTAGDTWGSYDTMYYELNTTVTSFLNMTIYEPCNYASNMATYHVSTEICNRRSFGSPFSLPKEYIDSLGSAYSALAMGSSFMHGSHTLLGKMLDRRPIAVVAYLIHQGSLAPLVGASSVLTDLSFQPRNMSALQLAEEFLNMYLTQPADQWYQYSSNLDLPDYYLSFAGIFSTMVTLAFPPETVDHYLPIMADAFKLPEEFLIFITDDYLPELRNLTADVNMGIFEEAKFLGNTVSTLVKMMYAFVWQEQVLTDNPILLEPETNARGWELLPEINAWANALNSFEYFDLDFQNGTNISPGDDWCNPVWPHAKWHLESAVGLLDLAYLGDEIHRLLSK